MDNSQCVAPAIRRSVLWLTLTSSALSLCTLPARASDCPADVNGDGMVGMPDLQLVVDAWSRGDLTTDVDGNGETDVFDIVAVVTAWGVCAEPAGDVGGPFLQPGEGWDGPTTEPGPVGDPAAPGYEARVIARWDVVPHQRITAPFEVGVLAFHRAFVDRVEFSLEGGPWQAATERTLNARTGVWEYTASIHPLELAPGPIEVRAIAYPEHGQPRLLEPLWLEVAASAAAGPVVHVDAVGGDDEAGDGSADAPFRSLWRASAAIRDLVGGASAGDGAVIACAAGTYVWERAAGETTAETSSTWITVEPAPGVAREDVHIVKTADTSNNGLDTKLVRLHDITLSGPTLSLHCSTGQDRFLWIDGCRLEAGGKFWTNGWYDGVYATGAVADGTTDHAFVGCHLLRGCEVRNFGGDAFKGARCAVNCSVENQVGLENSLHSDIWQNMNSADENVILYGITTGGDMQEQGIFSRTAEHLDVAIVNCEIVLNGYPSQNQWRTRSHHLVVRNNTFLGTPFRIVLSDSHPDVSGYFGSTDAVWEHNVFQWFKVDDPDAASGTDDPAYEDLGSGTVIDANHFVNEWPGYSGNAGQPIGEAWGTASSTGPSIPPDRGAWGAGPPPWQ